MINEVIPAQCVWRSVVSLCFINSLYETDFQMTCVTDFFLMIHIFDFLGLSPPVKYFTDRSKAVLLLWILYVFVLSCVCYVLCASVYMCFVVTCWERADLLALVCGVYYEFVTFPLVSWVRCGT